MKHIILFIFLFISIAGFSQSDNPNLNPTKSHLSVLRDGKKWFLEPGANGTVLTSNGTEIEFSAPTGSGTDSLSILQDSIIVLYAIGVEVGRDTLFGLFGGGTPGASTLNEVSVGSTTAPSSIYDMTSTVDVEFESSDNNTILLLSEANERVDASNVRIAGLTASEIVATDADKDLVSLAVATYPSLTELTYVKGVTSAIQTQLNTKTSGSGTIGVYSKWSGTTALADAAFHENTASYITSITRGVTVGDLISSTAAGSGFRLQRGTVSGGFNATASEVFFNTTTNHGVRFQTNASDVMMLNNNQTVSIGSTGGTTSKLYVRDIVQAASGSLFGSALLVEQTWNTSGDPVAILLNVTNTASGGASRLLDLRIATVSQFYVNKAGNSYLAGSSGIGIASPISKAHIYEDNANTSTTVGLTIEQDGAGDAMLQYLLTGGRRWVSIVDNSDADKYKIQTDGLDYFEIDANAETMDLSIHGTEKISVSATKTNITNAVRYSGILDASVWAAQVDDWTPSGGDSCSIFLIEMTGGSQILTGMNLTNVSGLTVKLINEDGADSIYIAHENLSSTSAYRFALEEGNDLIIPPSGCAECIYSPNVSRWRCWKLWFFLIPFRFRKRKLAA
jgi:hypothetical protein